MHHKTLKAAVEKYKEQFLAGQTTEEITEALAADEKGYSADDINTIIAAIFAPVEEEVPTPAAGKPSTLNKQYEEWKVKAEVANKRNRETDEMERVVTFKKDAQDPIRTTSITADKAEILNSQSENTLLRLYEVK